MPEKLLQQARQHAGGVVGRMYPVAPIALLLLFGVLLLSILRTSVLGVVDEEKHVFFEITVLLLLAILAEVMVVYLRQPTVMILLLLGVLMSPAVLDLLSGLASQTLGRPVHIGIIRASGIVGVFAQLGAIFLLFKVGLESQFQRIFSKENLLVAALGVLVPFAAGYGYALYSGGSFVYALFLGAALTATSVGVTVALLREAGLMKEKFADVIIGAAVIDDILGLIVLAFVVNIGNGAVDAAQILGILASVIVFLGGGILAGRVFLERFLDKLPADNKMLLLALAFLLAYAYISEFIGLSSIIGAFLGGLLLTGSRHLHEIVGKTQLLESLFTPIFFISLGMLIDVRAVAGYALPILMLTGVAFLSKVIGCGIASRMAGLGNRESAMVGIGMSPRGEVALIIALLGLSAGVLSDSEYTVIASMAFLTTLLMPPFLQYLLGGRKVHAAG